MTEERAVVAGVDGSKPSLHALRWAAREAAHRSAPLVLLHSVFVPRPEPYVPFRLPRSYADALREQGEEWLTDAAKAAEEAAPGVRVHTEQWTGPASGHLLRLAESAELLVVGSRGLGAVGRLLLGSVATEVAQYARCPVVVIRGPAPEAAPPEAGPIVVGVDGSKRDAPPIRFAFDVAASRKVPLIAVHAGEGMPEEAHERLRDSAVEHPGVEVREHVVRDGATRALLDAAQDAQLVVVGARGHGGFAGLGSTSQAVLHRAPCPVAIVREREAR